MATNTSKFRLARDPVFYTNLVAALIMLVATFFFPLTADQQGLLNALAVTVAGAVSAWAVSDGQLALVVGLFKAIFAVAISFGLHMTPEQQLVLITLVQAVGVAFVRTQVGAPVPPPASTASPVKNVGGSVTPG
jgi:hypothetical protein